MKISRMIAIWLSGLFGGLFIAVRWPHFDVWLQSEAFILGAYSNAVLAAFLIGLSICLVESRSP